MSTFVDPPSPQKPNVDELKTQFTDYINAKIQSPSKLSELKTDEFRLATYNIHYFTDANETQNTYDGIISDIQSINADVIGLEEFVLGNKITIKYQLEVDTTHFYDDISRIGYDKSILCNSVPSWYKSLYGNVALISDRKCKDICTELDETIHTFDKSTRTVVVSGSHQGTAETRCFIFLSIKYNQYTFRIYITHLDVASEDLRANQIEYIFKDSQRFNAENDVVFVMGDFNSFIPSELNDTVNRQKSLKDYGGDKLTDWRTNDILRENGKVFQKIQEYGFIDCHEKNTEIMTTWNTTRVDFILCNKNLVRGQFRAEYLYTLNSDHIPVVLTLTSNVEFITSTADVKQSLTGSKLGGKRKSKKNKRSVRRNKNRTTIQTSKRRHTKTKK